ncbi:MAG: proteasome accessory factor PafA2 family protein [Candidatus Latescibacterota bacterium]|nr:proteasome accessory factor PafA2 family protein [Candidatus Latescibacterota bacterium]
MISQGNGVSRLFGLETEYGIQVDGVETMDVVVESMELIRCYLLEDFVALWDYGLENPRKDMRGFEVSDLLNDKDETLHLQKDRERKIPLADLKSDLIISNGARLYNDHTHPEYSTPECRALADLVASDRAGERILLQCANRRTADRGNGVVRLYKNNTDFEGHSYGCHENYLVDRQIPFQRVIDGLLPYLVSRQIFTGAGKVGVEADRTADPAVYQLAQRSDFFECIASVDTMTRRPLVNTRDEPHAQASRYRRLHIILGDSNMSEYVTALKVGTALLVLELMEKQLVPPLVLADPVGALKQVSRDQRRQWAVELAGRRHTDALAIQQAYLDRARAEAAGRDKETDWVLAEWDRVLAALAGDASELVGKCDWVTKKWMLDAFVKAEGLDWGNAEHRMWLQSQDLEYHNIDPAEGLFLMYEAGSGCERVTTKEEIARATVKAPAGTRAYFRGRSLEKFGSSVRSLNWDSIEFELNGKVARLDLKACVDEETAAYFNDALDRAGTVQELMEHLSDRAQP